MSKDYAQLVRDAEKQIADFFDDLHQKREDVFDNLAKEANALRKAVEKYIKTKKYDPNVFGALNIDGGDTQEKPGPKRRGRKPLALTEINEDILEVKIKKEKISDVHSTTSSTLSSTSIISIKENVPTKTETEEMPAPAWIPPAKKKQNEVKSERPSRSVRSTRTKGRKATEDSSTDRNSDVVIQNSNISTVSLSDNEESDSENKPVEAVTTTTRSTRTKTRQKATSEKVRESGRNTRKNPEESTQSEAEEAPTRSTRTKTIRKAKNDASDKEDTEEPSTRSTRTKTNKQAEKEANNNNKKTEEDNNDEQDTTDNVVQATRKAKTKAKKNQKEQASDKEEQSDSESVSKSKKQTETNDTKSKRLRSASPEEKVPKQGRKKSKSNSPGQEKDLNNTGQTVYEDARTTVGVPAKNAVATQLNSTYVADNPPSEPENLNLTQVIEPSKPNAENDVANSTVVLEKPQILRNEEAPALTDEESIEIKTPPKKLIKSKATKEVFSPYEKSSTKKKVEAFEKLQQASTNTGSALANKIKDPGSALKQKPKYYTPVESKSFHPTSSSTSKISRLIQHGQTTNESLTQLRTTQKESRERQRKMLEREQAKMKKEAMLHAAAEAKKKLNEEKQMRALQQRKALEAEKQKILETQKLKAERVKQREQEREEYLQKHKSDLEKKRIEQKKKIQELQMQKQQQYEEQVKQQPPVYMVTRPPLLPTKDCYDSDDPEYQKTIPPPWCAAEHEKRKQFVMMSAGEKIKNTLFCRHAQTPDLIEIFQVIDPKKLRRNSSVLWKKPPRYTMMPDLNETRFSDLEDDD